MFSKILRALRAFAQTPVSTRPGSSPYADPYALQTTRITGGQLF